MPAGSLDYSLLANVAQSVTPKYFNRKGSKYGIINEARPRTIVGGKLFKRASTPDWEGGNRLAVKIKFTRARVNTWMGPTDKLTMKNVPAPEECTVYRRFMGFSVFKPFAELDHNKGEKEVIYDVMTSAKDDICTDTIQEFEDLLWAPDGNYAHDGAGTDFLLALGLKYWITIDGLHITGDTSKAVGGINPTTFPGWKNPYINPVTSSDWGTDGKIASIYEWREAADRMLEELRWESIKAQWGAAGKDIYDDDTFDPDSAENPKQDYMIAADRRSVVKYGSIIFDRHDNMGADQGMGPAVFKGIPIESCDQLGIDRTYGYGFDSSGNALWTDRGGSYTSGNWKGYGETMFINAKLTHILTHPNHAPYVKPAFVPEGMFGLCYEGDWWLQTIQRSRRRGGGYIGPYALN